MWQDVKWSKEASVTNGQLSNSNTVRFSAAHGDNDKCLIPSSVISSQCDKVWKCLIKKNVLIYLKMYLLNIQFGDSPLLDELKWHLWWEHIRPGPFFPKIDNSIKKMRRS